MDSRIRASIKEMPELSLFPINNKLSDILSRIENLDISLVNEFHSSKFFRKIHLEIASLNSSLEIFHCVFFPYPIYDLPIFGVDLVVANKGISAAIVDLSPLNGFLSNVIQEELNSFKLPHFTKKRVFPAWGDIFSSNALFIQPTDLIEFQKFLEVVEKYLYIISECSYLVSSDPWDSKETEYRRIGQKRYCTQQKKNDKTRMALRTCMSNHLADLYIDKVLFDTSEID